MTGGGNDPLPDLRCAILSARGLKLDVLVKVDVGLHRCGIDPD